MAVRQQGGAFNWLTVILLIVGGSAGLAVVAPGGADANAGTMSRVAIKWHKPSPIPTTTSTPTNTTPTTTTTRPEPVNLLTSKALVYGSEIGAWLTDGGRAVDPASGVPSKTTAAAIPIIRYAVSDCFLGMTCGSDNHPGTLSRTSFDHAVQGIVNIDHAALWLKMVPIAADTIGSVNGTVFCPPWTGDASGNLPMYKSVLAEVAAAGYKGPIVIESNNEMEYACWAKWKAQGAAINSAGSIGVSKRIGEHFASTMPTLKAYARGLGFSQVVVGGYIGIGGGTNWGQTCTVDATKPYGYNCGYLARWMDEFNTAVHGAYVAAGSSNADYIPDFESVHAYPHSPDFTSASGYEFNDNIAFAYYRNWIIQSRARADLSWGKTVGDQIRFSISEFNAGATNSSGIWSGWTTAGRPEGFYTGWYGMLRGDGNLAGTRYWNCNLFEIASNSDTGSGRYYNIIHADGTVPPWYDTFRTLSTTDPLR